MHTDKDGLLLDLAGDISDELNVDWNIQSDDNAVHRLQQLDGVARAFRDLRDQGMDSTDSASGPNGSPILFQWGHLNVLKKLGQGSFGEVFRAWDTLLEREVALKLRHPGPSHTLGSGHQYIKEARSLARLRHPNVLTIYGADVHNGRTGLWTELVEGRTLEQQLTVNGPIGPDEAILIGRDLCRALAAVHKSGLVHGDIKAADVIREQGGRLVLADLGSATNISDQRNSGEEVYVSPLTTAPEVLEGAIPNPEADLYSLGVLLYRLLSNSYPLQTENLSELLDLHRRGERRPLRDARPDLPAEIIRLIERAIAPEPENRFASAGAMERALEDILHQTPNGEEKQFESSAVKSSPWLLGAAVVLVVVAGLWLTNLFLFNREPITTRSQDIATAASLPNQGALQPVPVPPLEIRATFFCRRAGKKEILSSADSIAPGDQLFMEVQADDKVHVYVINEDADGAFFVLFPLPGLDTTNPLAGSNTHRLPGRRNGAVQDWQVTTAGGTETFMVVASRDPLHDLETDLNDAPAAVRTTSGNTAHRVGLTRGVGGVIEAKTAPDENVSSRLDMLYKRLTDQQQNDHNVWVTRFVLGSAQQ